MVGIVPHRSTLTTLSQSGPLQDVFGDYRASLASLILEDLSRHLCRGVDALEGQMKLATFNAESLFSR